MKILSNKLNKSNMTASGKQVLAGVAGFGVGQMFLTKTNKPIADVAAAIGGIALAAGSSNVLLKAAGVGIGIVGAIRCVNRWSTPSAGEAPSGIKAFVGKFVPNLQGLGGLNELGMGNPVLSYDQNGNILGLEGFDGDELEGVDGDDLEGFDGDELEGIDGENELMGLGEITNLL